jgi:S-DNA-T family DNA segregation ATPase FtsK/SpoIIIE
MAQPFESEHDDTAEVIYLPGHDVEAAPETVEGELVTDQPEPTNLPATRGQRLPATRRLRDVVPTPGPRTRAAAIEGSRTGIRVAVVVAQGHLTWAKRARRRLTLADHHEAVKIARHSGDQAAYSVAIERLQRAQMARHQRIKDLPVSTFAVIKATVIAVGALLVLLLVVIPVVIVVAGVDGVTAASWYHGLGHVLQALISGGHVASDLLLSPWTAGAAALGWVGAAYLTGRGEDTPRWLLPEAKRFGDVAITADAVTQALVNLKIADLTRKLTKEGQLLDFIVPPREQGGGTYLQVKLPVGIMAADILKPEVIERLAGNLNRHKHETYPQRDPEADARVLDLWVADKGALDQPAPEWPLLAEGEVDVWKDNLPWGVTMRGEQVEQGMLQRHWLIGATSKQGKTTVFRLVALFVALDPTVELHIADLKGDGDWSMFRDRAATLIEGGAEEHAEATCDLLGWGVTEMRRRYEVKTEQGLRLDRALSRQKGSGFHPIYIMVDECQILYGAPAPVGGTSNKSKAWRYAKTLHDQARAVNIHFLEATQRPDDRTLPVQVREGAHVRVALNVPNESTARMILADTVDRGARPQDLRPFRDRGTVVATGEVDGIPAGQAFVIIKTHYVDHDQSTAVAARSVEIMRRHGRDARQSPVVEAPEDRDLLDDLDEVMHGEQQVRTETIVKRLAELHAGTYGEWTTKQLNAGLRVIGVTPRKRDGGKMHLLLADLQVAIANRADEVRAEDADDDGE